MSKSPSKPDSEKTEAFTGKVLGDTAATFTTILAFLGDRLGLFKELAAGGPATSEELAQRARVNERYAREWLGAMASAGYLEYAPGTKRFTLPAEHAPALAEEGGPHFFAGAHEMIVSFVGVLDALEKAFREGGGVRQDAYGPTMRRGMERFTIGWFNNFLLQEWLPAMPDVEAKLRSGGTLADVGCGRGHALVRLARQFPEARFVGYDIFEPTIAEAEANARAAGVHERVRFRAMDVAKGPPERYDVVTTFDVVHDSPDPLGLLRAIRGSLSPGGIYVCLDVNCSDRLEENLGALGSVFHGFSVLYCMTTSLGRGGAGLGTLGFHEPKVRELCAEAGFREVRRVPIENPFNKLYEIRP